MQHRTRASRIIIVVLTIALASITLVAAAIYYYYTAQVQVTVESPKVTWLTGSDITASIGTNKTWCQITIGNLEPNATTVYTNALKFTVGTSSSSNGMALQVTTLADTNTIVWGIRFYVFTQGASSTSVTLVDGGNATIGSTDGNIAVAAVGYRQSGASSGYGSITVPTQSSGFTGSASTTYIIAIEVMGKDGILTTQSASLQLKLLWS
ncbi:MAG: hypothetical protein WBV70_02655 [Candidatus Bathyarchaeia archaeon]